VEAIQGLCLGIRAIMQVMQRRGNSSLGPDSLGSSNAEAHDPAAKSSRKVYRAFSMAVWHTKLGPMPLPIVFLLTLAGMSAGLACLATRPQVEGQALRQDFLGKRPRWDPAPGVGTGGKEEAFDTEKAAASLHEAGLLHRQAEAEGTEAVEAWAPAAQAVAAEGVATGVVAATETSAPEVSPSTHKEALSKSLFDSTLRTSAVRGVPPELQRHYEAFRLAGNFECFDGSGGFESFEDAVNDDYCDCQDGSDEPGTSACSSVARPSERVVAKFACAWQSPEARPSHDPRSRMLSLSAINDGICDCCGGEDEWDSEVVCQDRCAEAEAEETLHERQALEGSKAREAYVQRAASLKSKSEFKDMDGGPDGVFFAVAAEPCMNFNDGDYKYVVCPFSKVSQATPQGDVKIGSGGDWSTTLWENGQQRKDYSKLVMGNGEHCFASHAPRRAEIHFECAAKPAVLSVQETQVCVYSVKMQTPAACHPLVHH
jgi:hypothetical protein